MCRENGWKVGDVLEGDEGHGPSRIRITAIGECAVLARAIFAGGEPVRAAGEHEWDLSMRDWKAVR